MIRYVNDKSEAILIQLEPDGNEMKVVMFRDRRRLYVAKFTEGGKLRRIGIDKSVAEDFGISVDYHNKIELDDI
jgi:hypothetical protein